MPKNNKIIQINSKREDIKKVVMSKVTSGQITMKPRWFFVIGSVLTVAGLVGITFAAIFLINLTIFLLRKRGPGYGRLELMLNSFPIWIPILAIIGIILGIWMLNKYDFSYKKNFLLIIISFVISVIIAGFLIDSLGLNTIWSHQGPMRRFYQQLENQKDYFSKGPGQGRI